MTSAADGSPASWVGIVRLRDADPTGLALIAERLGPHDSERFIRFGSHNRQREFLCGRWLLHQAVTAWLGKTSTYTLDSRPSGAPFLILPDTATHIAVSLSHKDDWYACALTQRSSIGIDIELMVERDFSALDEMAFYHEPHPPLRTLPVAQRCGEFYRRWTRSEARFKAGFDTAIAAQQIAWHTFIVHGELMLTLCTEGPARTRPELLQWTRENHFSSCEAALLIEQGSAPMAP